MRKGKRDLAYDDWKVASPGVYECPGRDESRRRVFVAIDCSGQCVARGVGETPSRRLMQRARAALSSDGRLKRVRSAPAPVLSRGLHRAPWHFHGDAVYVAVDDEGVCRAEAVGMDYQASAYLWAALGDARAERTRRGLAAADERRFQKLFRAGMIS